MQKLTNDTRNPTVEFYNQLTRPPPALATSELRELVLKKKQARKIFVQPNTFVRTSGDDGEASVELVEYDTSREGVIESFVARGI